MGKPNFLLDRMKESVEKMIDIATKKNKDYSGAMPFQNFMLVEHLGAADAETGVLVRMCDKVSRISNLLKSGEAAVLDESIHDTLLDLANYALILDALIAYKAGADKVKHMLFTPVSILEAVNHIGKRCEFDLKGMTFQGVLEKYDKGVICADTEDGRVTILFAGGFNKGVSNLKIEL